MWEEGSLCFLHLRRFALFSRLELVHNGRSSLRDVYYRVPTMWNLCSVVISNATAVSGCRRWGV